jgi:hypothetical protein
MPDFTLTRSGGIPVKFSGQLLGSVASGNTSTPNREASNRQWFEADLFSTDSGKFVAHVRYRAGSRIAREEPCDRVYIAATKEALDAQLAAVDPVEMFVVGWPDEGRPESNGGRDFRAQDASICKHAEYEWQGLLPKIVACLGIVETI